MNYRRRRFGITTTTALALVANLVALPQSDSFALLASENQIAQARQQRFDSSSMLLSSAKDHRGAVTTTSMPDAEFAPFASTNTTSLSASQFSEYYDPSDELIHLLEEGEVLIVNEMNALEETFNKASTVLQQQQLTQSVVDDIVRDLDGNLLTKDYFATRMGIPTEDVGSYVCPEEDAFRGFMSNACRVRLVTPGGDPHPTTAFYKRIVFASLDHAREKCLKSPFKLKRDVKSYHVVASFLQSNACKQLKEHTGVIIPTCYDVRSEPDYEDPMQSKFSFLFEDLAPEDGWYQEWLLEDSESCEAALSTLAKIHAYFWEGSDFWKDSKAANELEDGVWQSGSYVQPMAQGADQWKSVASEWDGKKQKFKVELSSKDYWETLGERLESVAKECGELAHPFANDDVNLSNEYRKYRTFTHGDPKQANLLFRRREKSINDDEESTTQKEKLQLGLIDFQWSGFGLAATDIAHFLASAVHADMLVDGGEERLMKYYYQELQTHLVEFGAYSTTKVAARNYSYETFLDQYEIAFLDLCRLVIAYTWDRFTEPVTRNDPEACARTMNKTSYNKSIANAIWLMSRCNEILRSRGV